MRIKKRAEQQSVRFLLFTTDSAKLNDARMKRANTICISIYFRYNKMFGFGNKYKKICKGGMTMPPLQGQWYEALKPEFGKEYYSNAFESLFEKYLSDLNTNNKERSIYKVYLNNMDNSYIENTKKERIVIDYIAGMTDNFFISEYNKCIMC